jgi:hypothetical protein
MYGVGLCDTLDDESLLRVLDWAYDRLEPGGLLVLSGVMPSHPDCLLMQYVLEWQAVLRTPRQLTELFGRSRFSTDWTIVAPDSAGVMLWITAQREADLSDMGSQW